MTVTDGVRAQIDLREAKETIKQAISLLAYAEGRLGSVEFTPFGRLDDMLGRTRGDISDAVRLLESIK